MWILREEKKLRSVRKAQKNGSSPNREQQLVKPPSPVTSDSNRAFSIHNHLELDAQESRFMPLTPEEEISEVDLLESVPYF